MSTPTKKCCHCGKQITARDEGPVFTETYDPRNRYRSLRKPTRWHRSCWDRFNAEEEKRRARHDAEEHELYDSIKADLAAERAP